MRIIVLSIMKENKEEKEDRKWVTIELGITILNREVNGGCYKPL